MLLHFALVLHFSAILITFCVNITFCGVTKRVIIHTKKGSQSWQGYYTIIRCDITVLLVFYYTYKKCNFTLDQGVNHSHYTVWCVNIPSNCVPNYTLRQYVIIHTKKGLPGLAKLLHYHSV